MCLVVVGILEGWGRVLRMEFLGRVGVWLCVFWGSDGIFLEVFVMMGVIYWEFGWLKDFWVYRVGFLRVFVCFYLLVVLFFVFVDVDGWLGFIVLRFIYFFYIFWRFVYVCFRVFRVDYRMMGLEKIFDFCF